MRHPNTRPQWTGMGLEGRCDVACRVRPTEHRSPRRYPSGLGW